MVVISSMKPIWRPFTSAPQELILGPAVFDIFINNLDDGYEDTLSKFACDTTLGGKVKRADGCSSNSVYGDMGQILTSNLKRFKGQWNG